MAKVDIIGFSVRELEKICNGNFVVDINFENEDFFYKYVKNGFNPVSWELKNQNQVLIKDENYKKYLKTPEPKKVKLAKDFRYFRYISFGDYTFDIDELGELLNHLSNEKKFKEDCDRFIKEFTKKIIKGDYPTPNTINKEQ